MMNILVERIINILNEIYDMTPRVQHV